VIETLFVKQSAIVRHLEAPLLKEREAYLQHLASRGKRQPQLQNISMELLHIVRIMDLQVLRTVKEEEIRTGAQIWSEEEEPRRAIRGNKSSPARFTLTARAWLRFLGQLVVPPTSFYCFDSPLTEFRESVQSRMAVDTLRGYLTRLEKFLRWASAKHETLMSLSLQDIDDYFESNRLRRWRPKTIAAQVQAIKTFLSYAETRGWCRPGLARSIHRPVLRSRDARVSGPSWKDVRRMINDCGGSSCADLRAKAILLLCSVYALRNSEVIHLSLDDFDWRNEIFTVRRAKYGRTQQFPIQYEVGETIIRYLRNGRPDSHCRQLFLSQHAPYRPLKTVGPVVKRRILRLNIESGSRGPHSLRHACATELLRKGTPLRDIANFLGHRDIDSVSTYAKHDQRALRAVAAFSLVGVR